MSYKLNDDFVLEGQDVEYINTPGKDSGIFSTGYPDMIVIHYTAGSSLDGAIKTLRDPRIKSSCHFVIGCNGKIVQLVPLNRIAWHAGKSSYDNRTGINRYSIGIELDNPGRLTKSGDNYRSWFGRVYSKDNVFEGVHRNESVISYWHSYAEEQIACVFSLCHCLKELLTIQHVVGHEEIALNRKTDPGPAFPLDKLRQELEENRGDDDYDFPIDEDQKRETSFGMVAASKLNFRKAPSVGSGLISSPLEEGTQVEIIDEKNDWLKVSIKQTGWVKKEYIKINS